MQRLYTARALRAVLCVCVRDSSEAAALAATYAFA